jgi:tetratricopeptide (TPR) repeat protein
MVLTTAVLILAFADGGPDWTALAASARQAYAQQHYDEALAGFRAAGKAARAAGDDSAALDCVRLEAGVQRDTAHPGEAESLLQSAAEDFAKAHGDDALEIAGIQEDLALLARSGGHSDAAVALLDKAISIRQRHTEGGRDALARDLTASAILQRQLGHQDAATDLLKRAIAEWDAASPGDPQCLPALDALAGAYRDAAAYQDAEPLLQRELRLRESAAGPDSSDLISTVDSLAYVEFGLGKLAQAEALYNRLLALWQRNAAADHPMVALTLDKLAELYAFQQKYDRAQEFAQRALALRTAVEMASLNETGRLRVMQSRIPEAEEQYRRAIQIGDLLQAPDEVMDPPLRVWSTLLHQLGHEREAKAVDKRINEALLRQADRDGRRELPGGQGTAAHH